jgi:hypothetical protein
LRNESLLFGDICCSVHIVFDLGTHRTVPLEQGAVLHNQHRRGEAAEDSSRRTTLDPLGYDVPLILPAITTAAALSWALSLALADDYNVVGADFALHVTVDCDRPFEKQLTYDLATLVQLRLALTSNGRRLRTIFAESAISGFE